MENPTKMDDLGGKPTILGNPPYHGYEKKHVTEKTPWPRKDSSYTVAAKVEGTTSIRWRFVCKGP